MRVIEPHTLKGYKKSRDTKKKATKFAVILIIIVLSLALFKTINKNANDSSPDKGVVSYSSAASSGVAGARSDGYEQPRFFTGEQFQRLYDNMAFPNTETLSVTPEITGDSTADKRIKQIAESRGYVLRSVPVLPIIRTNIPNLQAFGDDLLQPKAYEAWLKLQKYAATESIKLKLNSGYRSIELQRKLFLERLRGNGGDVSAIAAGRKDDVVVKTLQMTAPPGYSRHHTGYTIDLLCDDGSGAKFEQTTCFRWLKADNYIKAKQFGWIPSYPETANKQGPEPESWEYVWVGTEALYE